MRVCLVGYGNMGKKIHEILKDEVVAIVAVEGKYQNLKEVKEDFDVIIDFSYHTNINMIADYLKSNHKSVVIGTTGYTDEEFKLINDISKNNPVIYSANYSLGVILMNRLLKIATPVLKDNFDIEVIEAHHKNKKDAPSGTAKMLINTLKEETGYHEVTHAGLRKDDEIGVSVIRGGSVSGMHEVMYLGSDEVLSIKHEASSRLIFANGAVLASRWLVDKPNGLYNMNNVLFND